MIRTVNSDCFSGRTVSFSKKKSSFMIPGKFSEEHFSMLIEISSLRSEKIVNALYEHLVEGIPRKEVCERHGASPSYFSVSLGRLIHIHQLALQLASFYRDK
ncbi:transcriptional regulator [Salmonella enterica subsp. enterica serovar Bredeney]